MSAACLLLSSASSSPLQQGSRWAGARRLSTARLLGLAVLSPKGGNGSQGRPDSHPDPPRPNTPTGAGPLADSPDVRGHKHALPVRPLKGATQPVICSRARPGGVHTQVGGWVGGRAGGHGAATQVGVPASPAPRAHTHTASTLAHCLREGPPPACPHTHPPQAPLVEAP
jgi:hypothetical protein